MPAPEFRVRIDAVTWADAPVTRRAEWRALVQEFAQDADSLSSSDATLLLIALSSEGFTLTLSSEAEEQGQVVDIPRAALRRHVGDYVDVVRQLSLEEQSWNSARMETLDMAKKVIHDDAAHAVQDLCAPLGLSHKASRTLFSLLLALQVDTHRLTGVHGHRPIR
jgi:uncharacterized protein (UPF0262 family)